MHYKMYKSGKKWVFAAIMGALALTLGMTAGNVAADTTTLPVQQLSKVVLQFSK